jgi:hypothetical protein
MPRVLLLEFTHIPDCAPAVLRQFRVVPESLHGSRKNPNCSSDGLTPTTTILDSGCEEDVISVACGLHLLLEEKSEKKKIKDL